ncbi:MAG TPA: sigma-E processing peptidase SpoIIGA [Thermoanaerobacterales bacterium]|nr:sigma-E processing peptidase SpoIIGA [Thermoanaerobacterales bacterium]
MAVYFDIVFLINLLMNLAILYFVALMLNLKRVFWRLLSGAIIGCLFLLGMLSEKFMILQEFPIKVVISVIMISVSFWPFNLRDFFKTIGFFYLISFMMGGGVLAFFYLLNINKYSLANSLVINSISVPWWILLISTLILYIFFKIIWPLIYKILTKDTLLVPITIVLDEKPLEITALIDTGNDLFDPISNYPVIIVELEAIKNIFNEDLEFLLHRGTEDDLTALGNMISNSQWASRFRVIPFESIGKSKGLMVGFKPDLVKIIYDNRIIKTKNAIIGIYQKVLSPERTYNALLNPVLLNA